MEERADSSDESTNSPKMQGSCGSDESLDRITGLPDSIILHILSFLPMKDAVKTGILSKRWEYLWASVPDLDFFASWDEDVDGFVNFVNQTLLLYEGSKIRKFRLHFKYRDWFNLDSWIRFAVRRKVEDLNLDTFDGDYKLPQHLYSNAYLTKLRLSYCNITPPTGLISWRLLKTLSLSSMDLSDNLIQDMLSGSPSLEVLDFYDCSGLKHLNITSPSLKKLIINGSADSDSVLEISAPTLQSLDILGLWNRRCCLMNLPCLVHATLSFEVDIDNWNRHNDYEGYNNNLRELLENLHHVKDLTIESWCLQSILGSLNSCELKILPSPSSKCKCLILDTCLYNWDLPGIASLLRSSLDLETLVVDMTLPGSPHCDTEFLDLYDFDGENYWTSSKPIFQCLLHSLKTVKIVGFIAGHHEMDLIQFLLKHAMVLEKMVIYSERLAHLKWRKRFMPEELLEFTQKMLSFPRASPHAVILFS